MRPSTEHVLGDLVAGIDRVLDDAVALRERLHRHPELAHAEHATSALILDALPVAARRAAGTGLVARIGHEGAAVLVRAELDGLPLREQSLVPFAATGDTMHACGHDVHMAALVALARAADELRDVLPRPMLAVFQPSEEAYPSGAELLVRGGELDPLVAAVGCHVHPDMDLGTVAIGEGPVNAACDNFAIEVEGRGGHSAYPQRRDDPVLALAAVVVQLHAALPSAGDPTRPGVVAIGQLDAAGSPSIVPSVARAEGTLRTLVETERQSRRAAVKAVVEHVAAAHGCSGRVEFTTGEPALVNDGGIVRVAHQLVDAVGMRSVPSFESCGADDFSFFGHVGPVVMAFAGVRNGDPASAHPLHHPEFVPPNDAVRAVARSLAVLYCAACEAAPPSPTTQDAPT